MEYENNTTNATPETPPETRREPEPVDTGRDVCELKAAIEALQEQTKQLTDELRRKDPEANKQNADFGAYFKDFMRR